MAELLEGRTGEWEVVIGMEIPSSLAVGPHFEIGPSLSIRMPAPNSAMMTVSSLTSSQGSGFERGSANSGNGAMISPAKMPKRIISGAEAGSRLDTSRGNQRAAMMIAPMAASTT